MPATSLAQVTADAFRSAGDFAADLVNPTIRLGVTGLARSGKTVFITALVHNLIAAGRLPFFDAAAEGRVLRAYLEPQPDDTVPRFEFEQHLADLTGEPPRWPESTRKISQLRIALEYNSAKFWKRQLGFDRLNIDIVDYPGEWLLDLPLLDLDYEEWSRAALEQSRVKGRRCIAKAWHQALAEIDPAAPADEALAAKLSDLFKAYLRATRADQYSLSTLPPGRFLMPGDLAGSPALTFAPLEGDASNFPKGSLGAMMERRYEAYKKLVVRPFFRDHFSRLDRQIVLIDVLAALNGGAAAISDLERAMTETLAMFPHRLEHAAVAHVRAAHRQRRARSDQGRSSAPYQPRQARGDLGRARREGDRPCRVCRCQRQGVGDGRGPRDARGSRQTERREASLHHRLPAAGETIGKRTFDGDEEFAIFPGDLPADPKLALETLEIEADELRFVRFRPPNPVKLASGGYAPFPNIRLDRALQALIGDRLA